tara:strand:+ start:454 stop:993 length:540 start_codon:yes stop_codon:yes gene_type:complete
MFLSFFLIVNCSAANVFDDLAKNNKKSLKLWIMNTTDINQLNEQGQTPLIKAIQKKRIYFVGKLLSSPKTDLNIIDDFGKTALDYAVEMNLKNLAFAMIIYKGKVTNLDNLKKLTKIIKSKKRFASVVGGLNLILGTVGLILLQPIIGLFGVVLGLSDITLAVAISDYEQCLEDYLISS